MKNDKWQFVVRTSDFYLSLFIIVHLSFLSLDRKSLSTLRRIFALVIEIIRVHVWFRYKFS